MRILSILVLNEDVLDLPALLGALGYPGFASYAAGRVEAPADVLLLALFQKALESRVIEALPWLLLHYPDMDHDGLVSQAQALRLQNRLGFVVSLARRVAEMRKEGAALAALEDRLRKIRLDTEDTFGNSNIGQEERRWIRSNRSADAEYWHILSGLRPELLQFT